MARRRIRKPAIILLALIAIIFTVLVVLFISWLVRLNGLARVQLSFVEEKTIIEVFSEVDPATLIKESSGEVTYPVIKTDVLGDFEIEFTVKNKDGYTKVFTHSLKVVDTTPPVISLKSFVVAVNQEEPDYLAVLKGKAQDKYDGLLEVEYEGKIGTDPGIYEVSYKAVDSSGNEAKALVYYFYQMTPENMKEPFILEKIVLVNKQIPLPKNYNPGRDNIADYLLRKMFEEAKIKGFEFYDDLAFCSYPAQIEIYDRGKVGKSDRYVNMNLAKPGYSEHQTGLAYDIKERNTNATDSAAYKWLLANCGEYGFILRYPHNKEDITGYAYEPWHFRYVGVETAKEIMDNKLTLEEYLQANN